MNRYDIMQKLKVYHATVGTSRTAITPDLSADRMRFVVDIQMFGKGTDDTVTIEKLETDGTTYTTKWDSVNVPAKGNVPLSSNYDIENPIIKLEGGTKLYAKAGATSVEITVIYWDNEVS